MPRPKVFWLTAGALAWTHVGYPLAAAALARAPAPRDPQGRRDARRHRGRRRPRRGGRDRPSGREPARARLPCRAPRRRRRLGRLHGRHGRRRRGDRRARSRACGSSASRGGARCPRRTPSSPELESEIVAFTDANAVWAPDALRELVRSFADPDVGYVCGRLELADARRHEPRGRLLALRALGAGVRVAARRDHRRERRHLRRAPRGLPPERRPAHGPRPRLPVHAGAGGSPRPSTSRLHERSRRRRGRARTSTAAACACRRRAGRTC